MNKNNNATDGTAQKDSNTIHYKEAKQIVNSTIINKRTVDKLSSISKDEIYSKLINLEIKEQSRNSKEVIYQHFKDNPKLSLKEQRQFRTKQRTILNNYINSLLFMFKQIYILKAKTNKSELITKIKEFQTYCKNTYVNKDFYSLDKFSSLDDIKKESIKYCIELIKKEETK